MDKIVKLRNIKRALRVEPDKPISYLLSGRIDNFRPYKSFNFIDLIDGSTKNHIQVTIKKDELRKPELGSYIICQGNVVSSLGAKQATEFKAERLHYMGNCNPETYPLATSSTGMSSDWYRKWIHLRPRAPHFASLLRVRSELELSLHMIMKQMDFFRVHTPSLTSNDSEASSDLFAVRKTQVFNRSESTKEEEERYNNCEDKDVDDYGLSDSDDISALGNTERQKRIVRDDYFNKDVFLNTSAQLHLESLAASLSRVYTLSTAFRAESSITTRHLCEFLMFEAEEANLMELESLMNRVESIIKFVGNFLSQVSEHNGDFNSLLNENKNEDNFKKLAETKEFIRMTYSEALDILSGYKCKGASFEGKTSYGCDIGRLHEKKLLAHCNNVPIFITNFPKQLKPFYMKCDENDKEALCFDLIAPHGGELCGGSLREDSEDKLLVNLKLKHQQQQQAGDFNWYLDSRRFGSFPHGGFGIGLERLIQSLLGIANIKDTTAFPRWNGRCPM